MTAKYPALTWNELSQSVQADLHNKDLGAAWFAGKKEGADETLRRTVLTLYVKMAGTFINGRKSWDFVGKMQTITPGSLDFVAHPSIVFLMAALKSANQQFTDPGDDAGDWDSREYIPNMQLHFRRGKDWGWADKPNLVEVHIDPHGLYSGPGVGQLDFIQMIRHWHTKEDYKKVDEIHNWLVDHNWGKTILTK
jgi:hypothetical protein